MYIKDAFNFYKNHIMTVSKFNILKQYNFSINGAVNSCDWEVFCAILFNSKKTSGFCDLEYYEIKSAKKGNAFEYQYHKNTGLKKLLSDSKVNHVFVTYDNDYKNIDVHLLNFNTMRPIIHEWTQDFSDNYENGKQRYRKSINYNFMIQNSCLLMQIKDGELV